MTTRLTEIVGKWIEERLPNHTQGETVSWDMSLLPGGDGSPAVYLALFMPGAIVGTSTHATVVIGNPGSFVEDDIDQMLSTLIERLREERSRILAEIMPTTNGGSPAQS